MLQMNADDIKEIVLNAIGREIILLNYTLEPFSETRDGILGSHLLLKIIVKNERNSEAKKLTFFVKSLPEPDLMELIDGAMFEEEINFYKYIQPLMLSDYKCERYSPKCYLAKNDVLVFEDLRAQGFTMSSSNVMAENCLKPSLAALARFHASTLLAEMKLGKPLNEAFPNYFSERCFDDRTKLGQSIVTGFKQIVSMAEKFNLDASFVIPHMYDYVQKSVRPQIDEMNVLCHTDLWKKNIMFNEKEEPECIIVDYQILRYATPVGDLSLLLYLNTTPEFRKNFEIEMVNYYYSIFQETLKQNEVKIETPTNESMLKTYKKYRLIGMVMAAVDLPGICLETELFEKIVNDPQALKGFMFGNRMEIIGPQLDTNPTYAKDMKDLLIEVLNEGKRVLNL